MYDGPDRLSLVRTGRDEDAGGAGETIGVANATFVARALPAGRISTELEAIFALICGFQIEIDSVHGSMDHVRPMDRPFHGIDWTNRVPFI